MVVEKKAFFDEDKIYRYLLHRKWGDSKKKITWIMLNPSTADEIVDDPTIRRCIGFSQKFHADELDIVNLFAFRSTNPKQLYSIDNPIGHDNDTYIKQSIETSFLVVLGWGNHGKLLNRSTEVSSKLIRQYSDKIYVLKILKNGEPGHPLYIAYSAELQKFYTR
jgi:hypothetical protein